MKLLTMYDIHDVENLVMPEQNETISADSPALDVFTDFKNLRPLSVDANISAVEAEALMLKTHVRMKIVLSDTKEFIGIVSSDDLNEQELSKKVFQGQNRSDLTVKDFMQAKEDLKALNYNDVKNATVGEVLHTLQNNGCQHSLVIEPESHKIRGIFSASDIARKMHVAVNLQNNSSFSSIYQALIKQTM
ncbi:CBS domain-containing protein [Gayadomonas joobiniege]|uniref:CBS domain-containing protein n=1 Tax=Gayadomonas joobiniege TaxID=1234606 RepID=UPI000381230A|nr:CBS domain-containing protein [Gayadomonas joobiniege]